MSGQRRTPVACLDCGAPTYKGNRCFVCFRAFRREVRPSPPVASTAWLYCRCGATAPEGSDCWTPDGDAWRCAECPNSRAQGAYPPNAPEQRNSPNAPRGQKLEASPVGNGFREAAR